MLYWWVRRERPIFDDSRFPKTLVRLRANQDTELRPATSSPRRVCGSASRVHYPPRSLDTGRTNDRP